MTLVLPMFSMVLLTFIIGTIGLTVRIKSVKSGAVRARAFKLMDEPNWPEAVRKTTRSLNNQFEVPMLFYVACTLLLVNGAITTIMVSIAWLFVIARIVHAYIHITYNHILHRMIAYWVSCMSVLGLWVIVVISYTHKWMLLNT